MAQSAVMAADESFKAEFSFIWKIKNFSHCFPWTMVRSPTFTVESMDKTKWCLHLWPKEYTNGIHMEYYLAREEVDSGPEFIRVAFELSFLDISGIQLVKRKREATFAREVFKGFTEFVEQAVVYTQKRREYLPENTLTACCRMRQIGGPIQKNPVACSATSVIGVKRSSFDWNIENFSIIRPGRKRSIEKKNPNLKIQLTLTGKPQEALQFEISHAHMDEPNLTDCEISVMNASKEAVFFSQKDSKYLEGKVWKFPVFLRKSQLTAKKSVYLRRDILALKCNITISLGVISSIIDGYRSHSYSLENESSSEISISSSIKDDASSVIENYPSTVNGEISLTNEHSMDFKQDALELSKVERKNSGEIQNEVSDESSSSSRNEGSSPTLSEDFFSIEDETVGEFDDMKPSFEEDEGLSAIETENFPVTTPEKILEYRQQFGILKKDMKEMEETRDINLKETNTVTKILNGNVEILDNFSRENSTSSMTEGNFLIQNEECSSNENETIREFNKFDNESFSLEEIVPTSSMKSDLQCFYQDGTFSDFNLIVGNDTFPTHKLILSLRSHKFREILTNDSSKTSIELTDLDSETLRDLLDFIYTNNVVNLTWERAQKLYLAAESYQVKTLRNVCYLFMKENINESNACNVLLLADEQQDEEVKQIALEFIVKQGKAILSTEAWDEMSKKNIKLAFETMQKMYMGKI